MSYQDFRVVTATYAGDATHYGVDDFKEWFNIVNGVFVANRKIKLAIPFEIHRRMSFKPPQTLPTETPQTNERYLVLDPADNKLKIKDNTNNYRTFAFTDDISVAGEANTGENIGTGSSLFKQKNGVALQLRRLNNPDGRINIAQSADTNSIEINLNTVPYTKGGTGLTAIGANGTVLTVVAGQPAWATPASSSIDMPHPKDNIIGLWQAGDLTIGRGLFATGITTSGTITTVIDTENNKPATQFQTGATSGNISGFKTNTALFRRDQDFDFYIKCKTISNTTRRMFAGFSSLATLPTNDDLLESSHGIGVRYSPAASAALQLIRNTGGASSTTTTLQSTYDNLYFTLRIKADNAGSKFQYSYNNGALTDLTTTIPAATQTLFFHLLIETLTTNNRTIITPYVFVMLPP